MLAHAMLVRLRRNLDLTDHACDRSFASNRNA
jgi:hypothetical protein